MTYGTPDCTIYVKPFVKHQTNDLADAEVIAEAAMRPTMRFVAVKSVESGVGEDLKTRDPLVQQRIETNNALRDGSLPALVVALCQMLFGHIGLLNERIGALE